jgi:endonuclease/exonuclease/phosphatase family metal-dependent hydrolase
MPPDLAPLWLVSWNLQGSEGVDAPTVAERIRTLAEGSPDVVVLQEVQRRQARELARLLGMQRTWAWKHWPVVRGIEGLAVLTRGRVRRSRSVVVHPAPPWSWQRRITLLAEVEIDGEVVHLADVHLSPHELGPMRLEEVARTLTAAGAVGWRDDLVVVGDCNDLPGSTSLALLTSAGFTDVWTATRPETDAHGDGATNWTPGPRHGRAPTQRLDYVLVSPAWTCLEVRTANDGWDEWAELSDHLPVAARLARRTRTTGGEGGV